MEKKCRSCGETLEETDSRCPCCGTPVRQNPTASRVRKRYLRKVISCYHRFLPVVVLLAALLCLILGIRNLLGSYDVTVKVFYGEQTASADSSISQLYEAEEFTGLKALNLLYGLGNAALAVLVILPFFPISEGIPGIRRLFGGFPIIGFGWNLVYLILFSVLCSGSDAGMCYRVEAPFLSWLALVFFALLIVVHHILPILCPGKTQRSR